MGGFPKIQIRVKLPAQAFDIEQGFLQQHQLRLNFHVEAARRPEKPQQHLAKGNVLERLVEYGFANRANRRFEFVDPGFGRHPARVDMQLGDPVIIALEKREKILGEIMLVPGTQRADNPEVHRDIAGLRRVADIDENIAWVHVGVKEVVLEHLGEKYFHTVLGQFLHIRAGGVQRVHVADRHAADALHDQDIEAAILPVHLRHIQLVGACKISFQLRGVGRFAHHVELVDDGFFILADHFDRSQSPGFRPVPLREPGQDVQYIQVLPDLGLDAGPQNLDDDFLTGFQGRLVDLCDRGRRQWFVVKAVKNVIQAPAIGLLRHGLGFAGGKGWHAILQHRELIGDVQRQQVAPGRQGLAEFDENRPEFLQREAHTLSARALFLCAP